MPEPITAAVLAASAVSALASGAGTTAGKSLVDGGVKLLGWLKDKLAPTGQAQLARVEAKPEDQRLHGALEVEIEDLLTARPELRPELLSLIEQAAPAASARSPTSSATRTPPSSSTAAARSKSVADAFSAAIAHARRRPPTRLPSPSPPRHPAA